MGNYFEIMQIKTIKNGIYNLLQTKAYCTLKVC